MNKLIKGNMIMNNVADKDVDMYIKAGWKRIKKTVKTDIKTKVKKEKVANENGNNSDLIEK